MADRIFELKEERMQLVKANRALQDKADAEKRDLTGEESGEHSKRLDRIMAIGDDIDRREKMAEAEAKLDKPDPVRSRGASRAAEVEPTVQAGKPLELTYGTQLSFRNGRMIEEPRTTKLDPAHAMASRGTEAYRKAFQRYALTGNPHDPSAVLQVGDDSQGGYLTSVQMSNQLIKNIDDLMYIRQISTVLPPLEKAVSLGVPTYDTDISDYDWVQELLPTDQAEDAAMRFGKRNFTPHLSMKRVDASMMMLRAGVIDIESFVAQRLAYKYATTEENAFLTGNGSQRALGVFTASADGIPTSRNVTAFSADLNGGNSQTDLGGDDFVRMFFNLKQQYQNNSTWVFGRTIASNIFELKDGLGGYLWDNTAIRTGGVPTLMGRPYYISELAPNTQTAGQYVAILGDFRAGYWIVDSMGLEVQRLNEAGALQNRIIFVARRWTDGMPVLSEAFTRLIMKA